MVPSGRFSAKHSVRWNMPLPESNLPDVLADIIELEVFLFGGVPERPEPVYGHDANDSVVSRTTRAHCVPQTPLLCGSREVVREITLDIETLAILDCKPAAGT